MARLGSLLVFRGLCAAIAVLGLVSFGSEAQAACGDYVMIGPAHEALVDQTETPREPLPCHGPQCSSRRTVPLAPPVPVRIDVQQDWLLSAVGVTSLGKSPWAQPLWCEVCLAPQPSIGGVFHPPRQA